MRILKFIVDKQIIRRDSNCDFSNLVSGTKGYLKAEFQFSSEWDGCVKAAVFENSATTNARPIQNGVCWIPDDILESRRWGVRVYGEKENYELVTNLAEVLQR